MPSKINSEPLILLKIVVFWISKNCCKLDFSICWLSSLWTDSAIEFWTSRTHKTRNVFWVAVNNNALAIAHDLPEPLPPYKTLYRHGLNRNRVLGGNCALIIECNFYFNGMGNWFSVNSCIFLYVSLFPTHACLSPKHGRPYTIAMWCTLCDCLTACSLRSEERRVGKECRL